MRTSIAAALAGVATSLLAVIPATAADAAPAAAATSPITQGVTALYEMNEPVGSTVMTDSSGNGNNGVVDPSGVTTGAQYAGATGYNWPYRSPTAPPASPERVVQVPDNSAIEPVNDDFTIEIRFRFTDKFGNMAQKGQAQTPGGQWKIQMPGGVPSCLFKGSAGQVATGAITAMDDGEWHTLTCTLTSTGVTMYVDGEYRNKKNGTVGTLDNTFPMTVGGKIECDQIDVTCDYFSGQVDYVKITKGPNLLPMAAMTTNCPSLTCTFNGTGSSDPDGEIASYAWVYGDGTTGSGPTPHHIYTQSGTYRVKLTVTDNRGGTDVVFRDIVVEGVPVESNIAYVGSAVGIGSTGTPSVVIPSAAAVGDRVLLVLTLNALKSFDQPAPAADWTKLDTNIAKTMSTTVWTKEVAPGEPGSTVSVPLTDGNAKYNLTAAVYSGVASTPSLVFGHAVDVVNNTVRTTPVVGAEEGSWVVSYWSDKSSSTTAWSTTAATSRVAGCGTSSARICSLLADSAAKVPAVYGNIAASTDALSSSATMWSIVLPTSTSGPPANQAPVADFASICDDLECSFDSAASADQDGTIASRSWTFGDGATSTAANPVHAYAGPGTFNVTLTVTDNGGLSDSQTKQVVVDDLPDTANVQYVASASASFGTVKPSVTIPAAASVGDTVLLALSVNSTTATVSDPAGWSKLGTNVAKTMGTTVWSKTVAAGDAGSKVTVNLSSAAKSTITTAVYSGVDPLVAITYAAATDVTNTTTKQAPAVTAPADAWVVSYWADKSSATTSWSTSAATSRETQCVVSSGRICSLFADSGGAVSGAYGPIAASTDVPTTTATMWSIVLPAEH